MPGLIKGTYHGVTAGTGVGKCMGLGTKVLMYDCTIKNIEDLVIGDLLMGDDSKPRVVLNKYFGKDNLFLVKQNRGQDYIINSQHILTLTKKTAGVSEVFDIPLPEYLNKNNHDKKLLKGFQVPILFQEQSVQIDPYLLGLWLGDGSSNCAHIHNIDPEILEYLEEWCIKNEHTLFHRNRITHFLRRNPNSKVKRFHNILKDLNILNNKHIPDNFLKNSRSNQLALLAGLIDSDGYNTGKGYEITQKNKFLAEQIFFLCKSLGYRTTIKSKKATCSNCSEGYETVVWRIMIYGHFDDLPIKVARKKIANKTLVRNVLSTGITVEPHGYGVYCGIEVNENGRFLLEDFTVVHNTKWTKFVMLHAYQYCKQNNIPFYCLWFAREESEEKFWVSIQSELLEQRFGTSITYYQIKGYHEGLTEEILKQLDTLEPEIQEMKKYIFVNDHVANPTGMLYEVERKLSQIGKFDYNELGKDDNGVDIREKTYVYNDPDTHFLVVTDHLGLLGLEPNNKQEPITTLHQSIAKWSKYNIDVICKKYQCISISIHQQVMDGDGIDYRKANLLVPTEAKLGGNKEVGRDYQYLWGLFKPWKYELTEFAKYRVSKFKNHFITLHNLKHRDGDPDSVTPLWFAGKTLTFKELPKPEETQLLEQYYV